MKLIFKCLLGFSLFLAIFFSCTKNKEISNSSTTPADTKYATGSVPTPDSVYLNIPIFPIPSSPGASTTPASFSLEIPGIPFDQGLLASCSSCASALSKSILDHTQYNIPYPQDHIIYSPAFLFNQVPKQNGNCVVGSEVLDNLNIIKSKGICLTSDYPYYLLNTTSCLTSPPANIFDLASPHTIGFIFRVDPIKSQTLKVIMGAGVPIIVSFHMDENIGNVTGTFTWKKFGTWTGKNHAAVLYGWDDTKKAFHLVSSWGSGFGENGSIWVDYDFFDNATISNGERVFNQVYVIQNSKTGSASSPTADFNTTGSTVISSGQSVTFNDQSTNNPTSWSWTFTGGSPTTSTERNPTVVYSMPGSYSVALRAANSNGADLITKNNFIQVNPATGNPIINLTGTNPSLINYGNLATFPVTVHNTGTAPLVVTGINITSDPYNLYYLTNGLPALPFTIPAGGTKDLMIGFIPVPTTTSMFNANLVVNSNATSGSGIFSLAGTANFASHWPPPFNFIQPSTPLNTWVGCSDANPVYSVFNMTFTANLFKIRMISFNPSTGDATFEWSICNSSWTPPGLSFSDKNLVVRLVNGNTYALATEYYNSTDTRTISAKVDIVNQTDVDAIFSINSGGTYYNYYAGHIYILP